MHSRTSSSPFDWIAALSEWTKTGCQSYTHVMYSDAVLEKQPTSNSDLFKVYNISCSCLAQWSRGDSMSSGLYQERYTFEDLWWIDSFEVQHLRKAESLLLYLLMIWRCLARLISKSLCCLIASFSRSSTYLTISCSGSCLPDLLNSNTFGIFVFLAFGVFALLGGKFVILH